MEGRLFYAICNKHRVSRFTFHVFILLLFAPLAFASPIPIFTDVTAEAGIDFKHTNSRSGEFYFVEQLGSGAAFLITITMEISISTSSMERISPVFNQNSHQQIGSIKTTGTGPLPM